VGFHGGETTVAEPPEEEEFCPKAVLLEGTSNASPSGKGAGAESPPLGEPEHSAEANKEAEADESFKPLEEDEPIFQCDATRMEVAQRVLTSFRGRVKELLAGPPSKELPLGPPAQRFCTDATLIRYLMACGSDEQKALAMLRSTLEWRAKNMDGVGSAATSAADFEAKIAAYPVCRCPCCATDPCQHCFLRIGTDVAGRHVIYSCSGSAANKKPADGMRHMSLELERVFDQNSAPGKVV
jgi:hypothetical protein